ncbi:MAG: metalloregulator ArsR/SmtB family transcription factor [Rikenellaceae bacterium]
MENREKVYTYDQEHLAQIAKALGHPARIAIMNFLAGQESCFFGDIHEVLPIAKATVSQHLTELKNVGLIQGEIIQPKVKYCINRANWIEAKGVFNELFDSCISKTPCCK